MAGRPRKPVEAHLLAGTYQASRHGPLPDDGEPVVPPAKPADLDAEAGAFWDRMIGLLAGVVRERDGPLLEQMAWFWAQLRRFRVAVETAEAGGVECNRALVAVGICIDKFDRIAGRFGMTPADRAKLRAETAAPARARVATRPTTKLERKGPPK